MRRIRRQRHHQTLTDISLTPLVDTALTLLIIFMVAAPMMKHAVRVTLPKGDAQESGNAQEELVVFVDAKNKLFWGSQEVTEIELVELLQTAVTKNSAAPIFIKADKLAAHGTVLELLNRIRKIPGVQHVVFPTTKSV